MRVTTLRLVQLRNHARTELAAGPGVNFLVGANAQGKSTLLEAVQLAATGITLSFHRPTSMVAPENRGRVLLT